MFFRHSLLIEQTPSNPIAATMNFEARYARQTQIFVHPRGRHANQHFSQKWVLFKLSLK